MTGVDLLQRRRSELPERSRAALDLVVRELGRLQSGAGDRERTRLDLAEVILQVLEATARDRALLRSRGSATVCFDKVAARSGGVLVGVDDAGPGVHPPERERVFERSARRVPGAPTPVRDSG